MFHWICRRVSILAVIAVAVFLVSALGGCGRVSRQNYDKVKAGMTTQQVQDILGKPDETSSGGASVLGVGGTATTMVWKSGNRNITVTFVNDKVVKTSMSNL
jgi:hypothetical protein